MTDDIVYDDSAWPTTMRGHGDVRIFLDHAWQAFPDLQFEMTDGPYTVSGQPQAAFYWKGRGTHSGTIDPRLCADRQADQFEGADFHEYRDGRVCRLRIVFDMTDVGRQIGTLPKAGSRIEKAGATVQSLAMKLQQQLRG